MAVTAMPLGSVDPPGADRRLFYAQGSKYFGRGKPLFRSLQAMPRQFCRP